MDSILDSINLTELAQTSKNSEEFMKAVSDALYSKLANEKQSTDDLLQKLLGQKNSEQQQTPTTAPQSQQQVRRPRGVTVK